MEDHLLQQLHDGLTAANNRRGKHGGIGGVANQKPQQNRQTFFQDDGETHNNSSGLYANFVKGVTLTSSREMTCSVIEAPGGDKKKAARGVEAAASDSGEDSASSDLDVKGKKRDKRKEEKRKRCVPANSGEAEASKSQSRKKMKKSRLEESEEDGCDSGVPTPPPQTCAKALKTNCHLISIVFQGCRRSLKEHLLSALPRCRRFLLVGGCGSIDVLMQNGGKKEEKENKGNFQCKLKKLYAAHLQGTCDLRGGTSALPSLTGIFHLPHAEGETPQVREACFASDDLLVGGRGVCEVWGFAFDKRGDLVSL